jgi:hypothetical protein
MFPSHTPGFAQRDRLSAIVFLITSRICPVGRTAGNRRFPGRERQPYREKRGYSTESDWLSGLLGSSIKPFLPDASYAA